jgi:hypothetical protein
VEDAKKKEMTGRGRGYLDELLKHEDDPLYWVKADGGADNHDEGDGKIDSQHADGAIRPDTEVSTPFDFKISANLWTRATRQCHVTRSVFSGQQN